MNLVLLAGSGQDLPHLPTQGAVLAVRDGVRSLRTTRWELTKHVVGAGDKSH